jgi:arylsulfatase A-like enzyme
MADRLNLIVIVCDTLRRDHLGLYGGRVGTPAMDRFAAESVVFDNAFACSFPTLPCRAELFTGKFVFPYLRWGPFPKYETTLAERLAEAGYRTALVIDNLPVGRPDYGYDRGFRTKVHIRGQWYDRWADPSLPVTLPAPEEKLGQPERVRQYLRNVAERRREEEYFTPRVFQSAMDWLETSGNEGPFYLHVECFDPHEPWDPPADFVDPKIVGDERLIYPRMGSTAGYTPEEMAQVRELYAGEVRLVDKWLGRFLAALDASPRRHDTAVVLLSDHGIFLGEHGLVGKAGKARADVDGWPPYREVSQIPLMMRLPGAAPRRVGSFVYPGDLMPTLLELAGLPVPEETQAASLLPLARGDADGSAAAAREVAVTAWSYRGWRANHPTCIRSKGWSMVWWRTGIPPRLHRLEDDPEELRDVYPQHREAARHLHAQYVEFLKGLTCPPRNYWSRRFFLSWEAPARAEEQTA